MSQFSIKDRVVATCELMIGHPPYIQIVAEGVMGTVLDCVNPLDDTTGLATLYTVEFDNGITLTIPSWKHYIKAIEDAQS